ncbi:MAG TPA: PilZ domain-containing protein [Polyangiaceae bacterium]|nr:PilZ domain-containing protein [Polyangiaceae bacterium]
MHPTFSHERRGYPRGYVAAVATVFVEQARIGEYTVRDLSAGGASLVDGPVLAAGTVCRLVLKMPGLGSLNLSAVIAHAPEHASEGLGVRFTQLEPEVLEGLRELVAQELECASMPSVLVADSDLERLVTTAEGLAALGERPVLARNKVDIVAWLSDPDTTISVVLVAESLCKGLDHQLVDFLREEFSTVRCFVVQEPLGEEELQQLLEQAANSVRPSKQMRIAARATCTAH